MNKLEKLTELFKEFPGIGPRQAKRFVYHLLKSRKAYLNELSENIASLKDMVKVCKSCFRFYTVNGDMTKSGLCKICMDPDRDSSMLLVVERDADFENIERTGVYNGLYFILGGQALIHSENPSKNIRLKELLEIVGDRVKDGVLGEVILAMSATPDGDSTAKFLKEKIEGLNLENQFKISTLGRGLSTGTELEYSDSDTLRSALKNRNNS